jgi:hypothetical protein
VSELIDNVLASKRRQRVGPTLGPGYPLGAGARPLGRRFSSSRYIANISLRAAGTSLSFVVRLIPYDSTTRHASSSRKMIWTVGRWSQSDMGLSREALAHDFTRLDISALIV